MWRSDPTFQSHVRQKTKENGLWIIVESGAPHHSGSNGNIKKVFFDRKTRCSRWTLARRRTRLFTSRTGIENIFQSDFSGRILVNCGAISSNPVQHNQFQSFRRNRRVVASDAIAPENNLPCFVFHSREIDTPFACLLNKNVEDSKTCFWPLDGWYS